MRAFIRTSSLFCLIQLSSYDCINAFSMTIPFGQQQHQQQSRAFTKINPVKNTPSSQLLENVLSAVGPTKDVIDGFNSASSTETTVTSEEKQMQTKVAYRSVFIPMDEHDGVRVPVALWYPANTNEKTSQTAKPSSPDDNLIMEYPESGSNSIANRDEETNAAIKPAVYNHRISDGAVTMSRMERLIPSDFERFREDSSLLVQTAAGSEERTVAVDTKILPKRAAFIFENANNAPNHISFLAGSVNDSMIALLSPLLPVAQMMNIPVLDFDKYKVSQDSKPTADVTIPLICSYLEKYML